MPRTKNAAKHVPRRVPREAISTEAPVEVPTHNLRVRRARGESSSAAPAPAASAPRRSPSPRRAPEVNTLPLPHFLDDEHQSRYLTLRSRKHEGTRCLCPETLRRIDVWDETHGFLEAVGWTHFISMHLVSYPDVTIEFLSRFDFEDQEGEAGFGTFSFVFRDRHYRASLAQVNEIFRWPIDQEIPTEDHYSIATAWHHLTGLDGFQPSFSKAKAIPHPSLRILHRFIAKSLMGRADSDGAVVTDELRILWGMSVGRRFDTAYILGKKLKRIGRSKTLILGGFIAAIVKTVTGFDPAIPDLRSIQWKLIDQVVLTHMGMITTSDLGQPILVPVYRRYLDRLRGDQQDDDDTEDDGPAPEAPRSPSPPSASPAHDEIPTDLPQDATREYSREVQRLHYRLDQQDQYLERMERRQEQMERRQEEHGRMLQRMYDRQTAFFTQQGFHYDSPPPADQS